MTRFSQSNTTCRRLIVDTDLGLDDLVALAILRLQQCHLLRPSSNDDAESNLSTSNRHHKYTNFRLCGVTLSSGISTSNEKNASLLRRLLPPETPVYVGNTCRKMSWDNEHKEKPIWWTRTADRVENFLSSLPVKQDVQRSQGLSAEQFLANNLNDPDVDILCMGPLTNISESLDLFGKQNPDACIKSKFYVMGGIRNDSKWTKRGESTAPFGYHDKFSDQQTPGTEADQYDSQPTVSQFGEFNFALDIESARKVLATVAAHIITLEACTLVPASLRPEKLEMNLSTVLLQSDTVTGFDEQQLDKASELRTARGVLLGLLNKFGTDETQWDSISAAIYCNVFIRDKHFTISRSELSLSELGACYFPGQMQTTDGVGKGSDVVYNDARDHAATSHEIHPAFTVKDELVFYDFLSSILFSDDANESVT